MSLAWERVPIMSNEELEELVNRPPNRAISETEYRRFNFAFAISTISACIFGAAVWVSLAWGFIWLCVNGHNYVNAVTGWMLGLFR